MTSPTIPVGGSTGCCHESSASIEAGADWLLSEPDRTGHAPQPFLRPAFESHAQEAIKIFGQAIGPAIEKQAARLAKKGGR